MTLEEYIAEKVLLGNRLVEWAQATAELDPKQSRLVGMVNRTAFALCGHDRVERQEAIAALAGELERYQYQLADCKRPTKHLEPLLRIVYQARQLSMRIA